MKPFAVRKKIRLPSVVYDQNHTFFITIATHQKHPWFRINHCLCESAVQLICDLSSEGNLQNYAWCLMPDHIHFLIQGGNIIDFIRLFKGKLTSLARSIEPGRKLWQRSFYDHALRSEESLYDVARYIWENPVRMGIAEEPSSYLWSGSEVWPDWRSFYGRG